MSDTIQKLENLHRNIANDVWPGGWRGNCHKCGKEFYYTQAECAYYLAHGWPECDCKKKGGEE